MLERIRELGSKSYLWVDEESGLAYSEPEYGKPYYATFGRETPVYGKAGWYSYVHKVDHYEWGQVPTPHGREGDRLRVVAHTVKERGCLVYVTPGDDVWEGLALAWAGLGAGTPLAAALLANMRGRGPEDEDIRVAADWLADEGREDEAAILRDEDPWVVKKGRVVKRDE